MVKKNNKLPYILIHGAWHARWCWKYVTALLKHHGHEVIAPDLPGHGNNKMLLKEINLATYVNYLVELVKSQHQPVVLVGHSMAGVIISQVAEYIPQHIEKLFYIAAVIPNNNLSLMQEARKATFSRLSQLTTINEHDNTIFINDIEAMRNLFFNCCNDDDATLAMASLQPEPFKPFIDKIKLSNEKFHTVKKTYIECLQDNAILPQDQKRMYSTISCEVVSLFSDHSPFFSAPEKLINVLMEKN